jgi:hypothetical protein
VNPLGLLPLLLPPLLASPYRGTLDLADRTDVRAGYFGFPTDPSVHVETIPSGHLAVGSHLASFTLEYAPRLGLADLQLGLNPSVLHVGFAAADWRTEHTSLTLSEYASYGFLNYSALQLPSTGASGTLRIDPLLRQKVLYEGSSTTLVAVLTPERRWSLRWTLSYAVNGGADAEARSVLPLVKGPRFEGLFDYALRKSDHLLTTASVERSTLSTGYDYFFLRAIEGWGHAFSSEISATIAVGATEVRSSSFAPTAPYFIPPVLIVGTHHDLYPTVEAGFLYQLPYRDKVTTRVRAELAPAINRATGLLSQQVQALVNASFANDHWLALVDGGLSQSLDGGVDAFTYVSGQAAGGYRFDKIVDVQGGARVAWQKVGLTATPIVERLAFVSVTVHVPTLRF